jgi:MYXO-CTERM domain-containing protein
MEFSNQSLHYFQTFEVILTATGGEILNNGVPLAGAYFAVGTDLEVWTSHLGLAKIAVADLMGFDDPPVSFHLVLDDTGTGAHDEVWGTLPEPGTLGLLALGAAALLQRRQCARP